MQHLVYITDGRDETCLVIGNGNEDQARDRMITFGDHMDLKDAWLELRAYPDRDSESYTVIDTRSNKPHVYPIWADGGRIVGTFITNMDKERFAAAFHDFQCNRNDGVPAADADPSEFCAPMRKKHYTIEYHPNHGHEQQWWIQER